MANRSLMYRHPGIYNLIVKILHGNALDERYKIIAREIGINKKVMDVGCGTGNLAKFLNKKCSYSGLDLNENFVAYAKNNGFNVKVGDLTDEKNYSQCDVAVICDVLHHIIPDDKKIVEICKNKSKRTIICEPFHETVFIDKILNKFRNSKLFHNLFGEADGINDFDDMKEWNSYGKDDVLKIMKCYGAKKTLVVGNDVIGIIENC